MSPLALSLRFLQTQSDAQLAALARAGHERAFEALVRRYRRPLLTYCRRVGSVGSNAEDTLQQALLQAWSAIRSGAEVRDPRAWLYRIVHNVAVSNERRPGVIPVELRDTAGANGADHEVEQRMAAREALAGLAALPDLQREVMVGTAVDGMSHQELASALGLSSGAVRGLIYRARATLRAAAASITPAPVISWALRSGSGPSAGLYEALAGGGSAGVGGLLAKGGVIAVTAGAIATATGISTGPEAAHHRSAPAAVSLKHPPADRPAITAATSRRLLVVDPTGSHVAVHRESRAPDRRLVNSGPASSGRDGSTNEFVQVTGKRGPGERHDGSDSGGSDRGGRSGSGSSAGSGSGTGTGSGTGSGSSTSGPDGSHVASGSTPITGSSGELSGTDSTSSSVGSSGGESPSGTGSTIATVSSDGGGGGSGRDGGMTTTTSSTATTTTTTATTPDRDGSPDAGHHDGN